MARTEARLLTEIWSDDDFLELEPLPQRMFMFLLSQPDLAHDGVIALRARRWAKKSKTLTAQQVGDAIQALHDARFIVADWDEEEVCVRSLLRRDRIFKQPNVMRSAIDHIPLIQSPDILRVLLAEMQRIKAENPELSEHQEAAVAEMTKALEDRVTPLPGNPSPNPSRNPSEHPTGGTPGVRGSSTAVSSSSPYPGTLSGPPSAGDADAPAAPGTALALVPDEPGPEPRTAQQIVGWWIDQCQRRPPNNVIGQMSKQIKQLLDEGFTPLHIRQGVTEWITRDVHPSVLPSVVNNVVNRRPRAAPARQPATERKFAANMQVAAALREREIGAGA